MTEIIIERESLGPGVAMVYRDFGCHVRMAFDPRRTTEADALTLLCQYVPRLDPADRALQSAATRGGRS